MSFAGNHPIRSALSNDTYAALPVFATSFSAPVVGRQRFGNDLDAIWPPVWNITAVGNEGSNSYTISWGCNPITIDGSPSNGMTVFFVGGQASPAIFSIENAGDNLVVLHVPDVDDEWTLPDNSTNHPVFGTRVTLDPNTGLTGQKWTLGSLD